jgi:hypothetical protein
LDQWRKNGHGIAAKPMPPTFLPAYLRTVRAEKARRNRWERVAALSSADVSLDETSICIVDEAEAYVAEAKVASDPAALADYLQATGLSFGRVGLEACPLSQWLYSGLAGAGLPVVCIEVRRAKTALSAMINKTVARSRRAAHGRLALGKPVQDRPADRVRECLENEGQLVH